MGEEAIDKLTQERPIMSGELTHGKDGLGPYLKAKQFAQGKS